MPSEKYFSDYDLDRTFKTEIIELRDCTEEESDCSRMYFSNGILTRNLEQIVKQRVKA